MFEQQNATFKYRVKLGILLPFCRRVLRLPCVCTWGLKNSKFWQFYLMQCNAVMVFAKTVTKIVQLYLVAKQLQPAKSVHLRR